jgi:hypothetical protein
MAKQTGLVKYSGTLGGVRHFKIKGLQGDFAGLSGGPTADQIYNDPSFERTRENMSEFGGSATAAKSIRVGLSNIVKQMSDPQLTGRLTAIMKEINLKDTSGVRGQRSILISQNSGDLQGFNFDKNISFTSVFNAPASTSITPARDSVTIEVQPFNPLNYINAPAGATHFRLINAITVISDYAYNDKTGKYEPVDSSTNGLNDVQYSAYTDLSSLTSLITLTSTLPGSPTLSTDVTGLLCVGIEFYQEVGSNYYLFSSGNALMVAGTF